MRFEVELILEVSKSLVEHLIDSRRSAHPNFLQGLSNEFTLYVLWRPPWQPKDFSLRQSDRCLKVVKAKCLIQGNKSFNQVQTNGLLSGLERAVEVEFESRCVEVFDLGRNLISRHRVLYDQMSHKIEEY